MQLSVIFDFPYRSGNLGTSWKGKIYRVFVMLVDKGNAVDIRDHHLDQNEMNKEMFDQRYATQLLN